MPLPVPSNLDAALFDFGGVFIASPFEAAERVSDELGTDPMHLLEVVFGPYHDDTDHPWHRLERGEMALEDARTEILALGKAAGIDADPYRVLGLLAGNAAIRETMVERVRTLRSGGVRTALVTNNIREFREGWQGMLPFDELFDVLVDSSELGIRKPNPKIFEHTLLALGGVSPGKTIFLDDYAGNISAAEKLGIHGILVGYDPAAAIEVLDDVIATAGIC